MFLLKEHLRWDILHQQRHLLQVSNAMILKEHARCDAVLLLLILWWFAWRSVFAQLEYYKLSRPTWNNFLVQCENDTFVTSVVHRAHSWLQRQASAASLEDRCHHNLLAATMNVIMMTLTLHLHLHCNSLIHKKIIKFNNQNRQNNCNLNH